MTARNPLIVTAYHKGSLEIIEFEYVDKVWFSGGKVELYTYGEFPNGKPFRIFGPEWRVGTSSIGGWK